MGLQFELRDAVPAKLASRARATGRALPAPSRSVRLGVRPVTRSDAGNWVRGQLTWGTLPYSQNRLGVGAEQHAWFLQLAALHRAGQLAGLPGESDWLHLDDFRSPCSGRSCSRPRRSTSRSSPASARAVRSSAHRPRCCSTSPGTTTPW